MNNSFVIDFLVRRNTLVSIAALSLPLGYLLAPTQVTPLWLPIFLFIFFGNFKHLRLSFVETLIFVVFPLYAIFLALAFNSAASFPWPHCFAIMSCFVVYGVGKYLFSPANYCLAASSLAASFWIIALIVFVEVLTNGAGLVSSIPEFVRSSGFSGFSSLQRAAGFWVEPGHLGVVVNFLFPFAILSRSLASCDCSPSRGRRPVPLSFFFFSLAVAILTSLATRSSPTLVVTILEGLILFNPVMLLPFIAAPFCLACFNSLILLLRKRSGILLLVTVLIALASLSFYILSDVKLSSLVSYFLQADIAGNRDILSAGDRAIRFQWAIDRIRQVPWGHGIAPYYQSGAATDFIDPSRPLAPSNTGYESSLSTPLDLALWAGPLWPALIAIHLYRCARQSAITIFRSSRCRNTHSFVDHDGLVPVSSYCFAVMISIVLAMLVRFCFIGNYYYPFLFLSVSLAAKTREFLLLLFFSPSSLLTGRRS